MIQPKMFGSFSFRFCPLLQVLLTTNVYTNTKHVSTAKTRQSARNGWVKGRMTGEFTGRFTNACPNGWAIRWDGRFVRYLILNNNNRARTLCHHHSHSLFTRSVNWEPTVWERNQERQKNDARPINILLLSAIVTLTAR